MVQRICQENCLCVHVHAHWKELGRRLIRNVNKKKKKTKELIQRKICVHNQKGHFNIRRWNFVNTQDIYCLNVCIHCSNYVIELISIVQRSISIKDPGLFINCIVVSHCITGDLFLFSLTHKSATYPHFDYQIYPDTTVALWPQSNIDLQ